MSLFITSLNSGSNGNCYYIGNDNEAVLIDAGISCRETEKRMELLDLSMKKVKAIFISHEHIDHIKGLPVLAQKYNLPVYITDITLRHSRISINQQLPKTFKAYEPVQIGNLFITAFPKHHDAEDPHSFIITCNETTVGVFTDIGSACTHVTSHFKKCHAAFLEANYDEVLLENGQYPIYLKNRIRGGKGHLSNKQALEIFIKHRPPFMTHLLLSHLSKDNNDPGTAKKLFEEYTANTMIIVASRYEQTPVYTILKSCQPLQEVKKRKAAFKLMQLSLFE
ncbi:MAG: MBL fold metallo-hydrolase [Ferruginibacter sp.]